MSKNVKSVISSKVDAEKWVKDNNGYPEVGMFSEDKWIKKFYKQLSMEQIDEWCKVEGLEYKVSEDSEPITRMRACMCLLYKHFPKQTNSIPKTKSKYADYSTEQLVQMAIENEVPVECTDDMRIMRMRVIMALRASKVIE